MVLDLKVGQVLTLKKKHPCGSLEWEVVRVGADIGIKCLGCGRRVLVERPYLERRIKGISGPHTPPSQ
jgi:hypothetical protein